MTRARSKRPGHGGFFDDGRSPAEAVRLVIDEAYFGRETFDESHYGDPSDGSYYD